jgi:hypothetical protein
VRSSTELRSYDCWQSIDVAIKLWGPDDQNLELIREQGRVQAKQVAWVLIAYTWVEYWPADPELISLCKEVAESTNVNGALAREILQVVKQNDPAIQALLARVPTLEHKFDFSLAGQLKKRWAAKISVEQAGKFAPSRLEE